MDENISEKLYHKIEGLYERDMEGTKELIIGKYRNPLVEYLKDCEWIFTEKIDGMNIRVVWDGHKVAFYGRTNKAELPKDLVARLESYFGGKENEQIFEQKFGETPIIIYGEGYGAGIQKGGRYRSDKDFIMFDVEINGMYLERESMEEIAMAFGVSVVPVISGMTLEGAITTIRIAGIISTVARGEAVVEAEGLVGVPKQRILDARGNRVIVKILTRDLYQS
jgi:hypothetical protein